jgi:hypothetical protein
VEQLRVAAGDGRLTAEELDERLETALEARTFGELERLTTDLPAAGTAAIVSVPEAKDVVHIDCGSGTTKRVGRWVVPRRMEIRVRSGSVKLDFTEAVFTQPTLEIHVEVRSGNLTLVTKPGVVVDTDDVTVRSGNASIREPWSGASTPTLLRIDVAGHVGSGNIVAHAARRNMWQWLMRRPKRWSLPAGS